MWRVELGVRSEEWVSFAVGVGIGEMQNAKWQETIPRDHIWDTPTVGAGYQPARNLSATDAAYRDGKPIPFELAYAY